MFIDPGRRYPRESSGSSVREASSAFAHPSSGPRPPACPHPSPRGRSVVGCWRRGWWSWAAGWRPRSQATASHSPC
eukprot:10677712-Alexandrium_andersonii.AAC.1